MRKHFNFQEKYTMISDRKVYCAVFYHDIDATWSYRPALTSNRFLSPAPTLLPCVDETEATSEMTGYHAKKLFFTYHGHSRYTVFKTKRERESLCKAEHREQQHGVFDPRFKEPRGGTEAQLKVFTLKSACMLMSSPLCVLIRSAAAVT